MRRAGALTRMSPQPVDPADHVRVEVRVCPHGVIDLGPRFHEAGQDFIDVRNREGVIRAVALDGTVGSRPRPVPGLAQGVVLARKQQVFALRTAGHQHRDRIRLRKSAQVVKMAVLPVGVFDIAVAVSHRRRRQDGNGVLAYDAHEFPPAPRELFAIHGRLQCSRCCTG